VDSCLQKDASPQPLSPRIARRLKQFFVTHLRQAQPKTPQRFFVRLLIAVHGKLRMEDAVEKGTTV
jgi:hypothetical protein